MDFLVSRIAQRSAAICELLATPDPPELRRAHVARLEGKPERFALISHLTGVFVQSKLLALEEIRRAKRTDGEPLRSSSATGHEAGAHRAPGCNARSFWLVLRGCDGFPLLCDPQAGQ